MSGLAVLSAIPHQEPRFLIPALPGIVLSTWRWHRLAPGRFWCLWVVFNAVLAIGYGVVHQAGVVPVLDFVSRTSALATAECRSAPAAPDAVCTSANPVSDGAARGAHTARIRTTVLFVSTYMAPRHLLAQPANNDARQARIELHDLVGMDGDEIRSLVRNSTRVSCALLQKSRADELVARQTQPGLFERTLVVIPASADMARVAPAGTTDYALAPVYSYGPHVNFDHVAEVLQRPWQRSRLGVFALCDDDNPR
ncbi:alpha 1,2 mannosyltransferase [Coemansia biformis]|uniref:Alpha 1,2 mannosyltransferase n=1 Tax=Coemansia biformis TaxID=1286918 RepID=A0A9W7Y608_9FUNG|nr:alpha 1,2 mannosyltransferase [Coemansia biformis]